ncbi:hypothetical protein ABN028_18495 [Actinopolymorpha sp. B17G11]|uniref:hypothetical protein n=1 Tax=unclassified Actinopolymorpha TaxID=2627063 RepID=UPI0032D93052
MTDVEVPFEDAIEVEDDEATETPLDHEGEELDLEAPEADAADQHHEVALDDEDYR